MDIKKFKAFLVDHNKTHVIFDFDETIFWLIMPWEIFSKMIKKHVAPLNYSIYASYVKRDISLSVMQNMYVEQFGDDVLDTIRSLQSKFESESLQKTLPNPDLIEFIRANTNKYQCFIWSTNSSNIIRRVLEEHDLSKYFKNIASRLELRFVKPKPDGFTYLFQEGVDRKQYVMVGNSIADKLAAAAAGVDFFHIDYFTKLPQAD